MLEKIKRTSAEGHGKPKQMNNALKTLWACLAVFISGLFLVPVTSAGDLSGMQAYERISKAVYSQEGSSFIQNLNQASKNLNWDNAEKFEFLGNLRILGGKAGTGTNASAKVYLIRKTTGEIFIIDTPRNPELLSTGSSSAYAGLDDAYDKKLNFNIQVIKATVAGETYAFARLLAKPEQTVWDKGLKIGMVLLLFFVMVGMGMTLTLKDFKTVFTKPRGILIGQFLQFAAMPFLAMVLGHLLGFHRDYPFIFVGLILITVSPGGVTSNLMTYYAKGDLALSISLTSISTILSIVFTPLLLTLYCTNMADVSIPVEHIIQTIIILVLIPLIIGMSFKWKWPGMADKLKPFFSALGIIALLVILVAGTLSNYEVYLDTTRYGLKFYFTVFSVTTLGMILGIIIPKLFRIDNYQTRAISLETGLRNSALAMTIALLLQDPMGDFYGSMLFTSAIFGLAMYFAGIIAIYFYKFILPINEEEVELKTVTE